MMTPRTVIETLAGLVQARLNCLTAGNTEWKVKHEDRINALVDYLPHGSGIDGKRAIDLDRSNSDQIVIDVEFHHMDDNGYYCGWTNHTLVIRPSFTGINIRISGPNRNDIKEYLHDVFDLALTTVAPQEFQPTGITV